MNRSESDRQYWKERRLARECRSALVDHLDDYPFQFFITLATNRRGDYWFARDKFKNFLARIDRDIGGRNWFRNLETRSFAIGSVEHLETNLHLHVLLFLPQTFASSKPLCDAMGVPDWNLFLAEWRPLFTRHWKRLTPQGSCEVLPFAQGATSYSLKVANYPINYENLMFSSEFYSSRCGL